MTRIGIRRNLTRPSPYDASDQHTKTASTDGTIVTYSGGMTADRKRTAHPVTGLLDDTERYTLTGWTSVGTSMAQRTHEPNDS